MSDIFEKDIDDEKDLSNLEDNEGSYTYDSTKYVFPSPLYKLKLEYSCEGIYATAPESMELAAGDYVIIPTRYGNDYAKVLGPSKVPIGIKPQDVIEIVRKGTEEDHKKFLAFAEKEEYSCKVFREKAAANKLDMKLISTHYLLDEPKVIFFFSSENRVDFRELVKDLVSVFKMRIELRQIGVRDESRITCGLGVCGRPYCCHSVSDKLRSVSIKMAKEQNLSLNSMKISGQCGRLLCCISYEYDCYVEARKKMPSEGTRIYYDGDNFWVSEVNPLAGMVRMKSEERILDIPSSRFINSDGKWKIKSL